MKQDKRSKRGFFLGIFLFICNRISLIFHSGFVYGCFSSYEKLERGFQTSAFLSIIRSLNKKFGKYTENIKKFLSRQFENSIMLRLASSGISRLLSLPGRVIGAFGVTWGAYVSVIVLIQRYAILESGVKISDMVPGLFVLLAAIPLTFSEKSLCELCGESYVFSKILIDVFGVPDEAFKSHPRVKAGQSGAVILGIIAGLLTYFISPWNMVGAAAIITVLSLIVFYPEGGALICITISPFLGIIKHSSITLAVFVLVTAISYFIKVLRGKRIFKVNLTDFAVYAFMFIVFISGFAPGESNTMDNALLCCSLMLIFPLIVNLMNNKHWIKMCVISFVVPAAIVAFIGVAQYLIGGAPGGWVDTSMFGAITSRSVSLFNNPNIFGVYLAALMPIALLYVLPNNRPKVRILGGIILCYIVSATIFTYSRSAWLALLLAAMVFAIIVSPKGFLWIIPTITAVVILSVLFPDTIGVRLLNFTSVADSANHYRIAVWNSSVDLLSDTFWFGIGWGEEAFKTSYINYGAAGTQYAMHSHSLYLQIGIQTGVVGLFVFALSVYLIMNKCFSERSRENKDRFIALCSKAAIIGVMAMLIVGIFDYSWYNFRVFFIFWALLGLASAAINVSKKDSSIMQYDDNEECAAYIVVQIPKSMDSLIESDYCKEENKDE